MAKNTHNVPKKQWAKWNKTEQATFNRMWYSMFPGLLPNGCEMNQRQFNVLRHNVSCIAADVAKSLRAQ